MSSMTGLIYALALLGTGPGQEQGPSPAPHALPDVTTTVTREEAVLRYVDALPEVNRATEPLARFDRQVCPRVVNLAEAPAQVVTERIRRAALDAGLSIDGPDCSPNLVVVFTLDGDASAAEHRRTAPQVFDGVARTRRAGRTQLREFMESDEPVRWWHATEDVPAHGWLNLSSFQSVVEPGTELPTGEVRSRSASRLSGASSKMEINFALVIVDMNHIDAVDLNALGDYAAFVALAQIDPEAEVSGSDTILTLFEPGAGPMTAMSEMDRSYLRALYRLTDESDRAAIQQGELASRILRDLERAD